MPKSASTVRGRDVDAVIGELGIGPLQLGILCLIGCLLAGDLIEIQLLSYMGQRLHCLWGIDNLRKSLLTSAGFAGMLIGSVGCGWMADKFGRRDMASAGSAMMFLFGCVTAMAPDYWWLIGLRFVFGVFLGASIPGSEALAIEFLPVDKRGQCWYALLGFWGIGALFEMLLAWALLYRVPQDWRWLSIASAAPFLPLAAAIRLLLPRSPRYCLLNDRHEEALSGVNRIAVSNKKPIYLGKLNVDDASKESGRPWLIFKNFPKQTLLLLLLHIVTGFGYFSIQQLNVQIPLAMADTCNFVSKNVTKVASETCARINFIELLAPSLAETVAQFIVGFLIQPFVNRRLLTSVSLLLTAFITPLLSICMPTAARSFVFVLARMTSSAAYGVVQLLALEFYPTSLRVSAVSLHLGSVRLAIIFSPFVAQYMVTNVSVLGSCLVYCSMYAAASIASLLLLFETKDVPMRQTVGDVKRGEIGGDSDETMVLEDAKYYGAVGNEDSKKSSNN